MIEPELNLSESRRFVVWMNTPPEPQPLVLPTMMTGPQLAAKRILDIVVASTMLVVAALPMLLIALLVRLTSCGPILYQQERVGKQGRRFKLLKFRTMVQDAESTSGPRWASNNDSRQTWLGRFLRRTCLDELPQVLNVLRGEMSLIGPRPERPHFVKLFSEQMPNYDDRHQVLPGLTGWAQVHGLRGPTSIEMRLQYDLHYVNNYSLFRDLQILAFTPLHILTGYAIDVPAFTPNEGTTDQEMNQSKDRAVILPFSPPQAAGKNDNSTTPLRESSEVA